MNQNNSIFIAGHQGLVGSAIHRKLKKLGYVNLITVTKKQIDLRNQQSVNNFFEQNTPEYVFLAAAKVGGIGANSNYPVDFIRDNLMIQTNIIDTAYRNNVQKLCFLGSSCIYPKMATQPIDEDQLLSGYLESTNQYYAIAKIAGIQMCQAYSKQYDMQTISVMPTNLYGPGDKFDLENGHVIPSLIHRIHKAKTNNKPFVTVWGSGTPQREFLYIDDLADACYFLIQNYHSPEIINIGTGTDITIKELVNILCEIIEYNGNIKWDTDKPDGTPRKVLNVSKINKLGWTAKTNLIDGLNNTYQWYLKNKL